MAKFERVVLWSCERTMEIDPESASAALGGAEVLTATRACTGDLDIATKALQSDGATLIACGQMASLFEDLAEELDAGGLLATADIRDRAGWTADRTAFAKQAALLAEAALPVPATPSRDIVSEGTCLVLGTPEVALSAAGALAGQLLGRMAWLSAVLAWAAGSWPAGLIAGAALLAVKRLVRWIPPT